MPKYKKNQILLKDVYKSYKKKVSNPVSSKEHRLILDTWGSLVSEALIDGRDVKLFAGMSTLCVRKKTQRSYVDMKASREAGKEIRRSNVHSGFYSARVYWRTHYTSFNTNKWTFKAGRVLSRSISAVMKTQGGHSTYLKRAKVARTEEQATALITK